MVSALWMACAENDVERVRELLADPSVDIEIKDHSGCTPLIQAVKNGHVDVVKLLLDRGASPTTASAEGRPDQLTADPAVLHLLAAAAQPKMAHQDAQLPAQPDQPQPPQPYLDHAAPPAHVDPNMQYWAPPPPGMYGYYAGPPPPAGPDGAPLGYYAPPPPHHHPHQPPQPLHGELLHPIGPGNLPPPDVARLIPCRYFPACRYGAQCMFAHPQAPPAGAYYPGAPVPAPYPYDPMAPPPFSPSYYPVSPSAFHPGQPGGPPPPHAPPPPHLSPASPHDGQAPPPPPMGPPAPEMLSPPPPGAYPSPISPSGYAPMPVPPPPPPAMQAHPSQGPPDMYAVQGPAGMPAPAPYAVGPPPPGPPQAMPVAVPAPGAEQQGPGPNGPGPQQGREHGQGHFRRGSARKPSMGGSRKPPCIFFPSGRCKNGDECRFPHVLPDGNGGNHPHQQNFNGRGGHRPRYSSTHGPQTNGMGAIDERFANMTINTAVNGEPNGRTRHSPGGGNGGAARGPVNGFGGARADHARRTGAPTPPALKQRLPGADEFPVLGSSAAQSPARSPSLNGPTAAQVLQAPAPGKRDAFRDAAANGRADSGAATPDSAHEPTTPGPAVNGHATPPTKLPVSFAAAANGAVTGAPDAASQVSVSA